MPVRGPAPYLVDALRSVLEQGADDVVVVDDGSDPPVEVAGARVVRLEQSGGPAKARDAGLEALGTDLIALADADDEWLPGKLECQLASLAAHPEVSACFGRAEIIGPSGIPTGEHWEELPAGVLHPGDLRALLFDRNPIPASSVVLRRSALEEVGGFDSGRGLPAATDWDLWLRLVQAGHSFVCEPRARIRYRRHSGGVTGDVARLAEASLLIHDAHAGLADADARRSVRARDLTSLARGRVRQRRYGEARDALREAAELEPPGQRERLLSLLLTVPGVRSGLGRRDPYRGRTA